MMNFENKWQDPTSKTVIVVGPIVKKGAETENYKQFLTKEASKLSEVIKVEIEPLPSDSFLFDSLSNESKIAVMALIMFKSASGPAKFISLWNGKVHDKFNALYIIRVKDGTSISDLVKTVGQPPDSFNVPDDNDANDDNAQEEDLEEDYETEEEEDVELFYAVLYRVYMKRDTDFKQITASLNSGLRHAEMSCFNLGQTEDGRWNWAFSFGFFTFSDRVKASHLYPKVSD